MGLDDYAQALGAAQRLVPNLRDIRSQELQQRGAQLQQQAFVEDQAAQQRERAFVEQRRDAFRTDIASLGTNPTPQAYRALAVKYPQFHNAIDGAAKGLDADKKATLVRQLAPVQALIASKQYDKAAAIVKRHIDADVAAGGQPDETDQELYDELTSGDVARQAGAGGMVYGLLTSLNPDTAAKNLGEYGGSPADKRYVVGRALVDASGNALYRDPEAAREVPVYDDQGNRVGTTFVNTTGGGGQTSGGGGAVGSGPVDRLINSDAGGGYVPESVRTLGQFVNYGRDMNKRGARSSSAGRYQINGSTMAEFAPQVLGAGWRDAPFDGASQDRVGEAIFNWAKRQPNPGAALKGRWVSLNNAEANRLVQGDWAGARGLIAQKETGGGASASAAASSSAPGMIGPVASRKQKDAPSGYRYRSDGMTLEPIPGGPADKGRSGGGKALPEPVVKRLEPKIDARDGLAMALNSFKDDFGGHTILGDTSNTLQSITGMGADGQRDWWAQFRTIDNKIRNELFGASLTIGEKSAFDATTITPRMDPTQIKRNLKSRLDIVNRSLARQRNVLTKNGFAQDAVDALFDPYGGGGGSSAPQTSGFRVLRVRPKQ